MNISVGGKPRAGKTKRVVIWLVEKLRTDHRPIVTNMALKMDPWVDGKGRPHKGLLRTLQDKYGETFDAERRVYVLKHSEVARFYAIRPEVPKDESEPREIKTVPRSDMWKFDSNKYSNCCYAIDEAEVYFPSAAVDSARASHEDPELLQWAKQAGRGGDDALFISQNLTWISIKLRKTCQECWWMVNHAHIPFSIFRRPDHITEETYMNCPPNPGEQYLRKAKLAYHREEIEGCYNTAEGVGVTGNSAADIGQRAKGLHWAFVPGGIVVLAIIAMFGLRALGDGVKAVWSNKVKPVKGTNELAMASVGSDGFTAMQRAQLVGMFSKLTNYIKEPVRAAGPGREVETKKKVKEPEYPVDQVIGIVRGRAGISVALDDGSVFMAREVEEFGREVAVDGVIYRRGKGAILQEKQKDGKMAFNK